MNITCLDDFPIKHCFICGWKNDIQHNDRLIDCQPKDGWNHRYIIFTTFSSTLRHSGVNIYLFYPEGDYHFDYDDHSTILWHKPKSDYWKVIREFPFFLPPDFLRGGNLSQIEQKIQTLLNFL